MSEMIRNQIRHRGEAEFAEGLLSTVLTGNSEFFTN
jgi:hypothetical protein